MTDALNDKQRETILSKFLRHGWERTEDIAGSRRLSEPQTRRLT